MTQALKLMTTENAAPDFLPFSHHVTNEIISTRNGEYLAVFKLDGRSHQCADIDDVFIWTRDLNATLRGVASENVSMWSHIHRRRVYEYPEAQFDNVFASKLNDTYEESFTGLKLMVNDLYLTVVYNPVPDKVMKFFAGREKVTREDLLDRQASSIKALEDICRSMSEAMRKYGIELLSTYEKGGHVYSAPMEWLSYIVNGEANPFPVCRDRFSEYMMTNRPMFSTWGEVGELRQAGESRKFGMIEIRDFDNTSEPGQLNTLLESDYEFILTQSFSALSTTAAKGFLQRHKRLLVDAKDVAVSQIQEIDLALDQLVSRQFVQGEYHCTLLVYGDDAKELRNYLALAKAAFFECGVMPHVVDMALEAAFWAQLPGNWRYRPRAMPVTSLNFLSFSPFHNFMSGKPAGNPWGPAVTILKTTSGTPLYFNFHVSDPDEDVTDRRLPGSTGLFGQTGSGKTVLLTFLLAQAQKFKPTVVAFDLYRGMEVAIRSMGGRYLPLKNGEPSGFNPFQLEPTGANMIFLKALLRKLATSPGCDVSHHDERELDAGLEALMEHIDKPQRRLSALVQFLPNPMSDDMNARPTVHARLLKWCEGGELGWLFDNPTDDLDLSQSRLYGFDVTDFLDNPETRTPTMMYLIFRTEGMIDGRRFMYIFDEFWKILDDDYFVGFAKDTLKTIRKKNGLALFATQEPGDSLESKIGKTIVQQLTTIIALENPKASAEDYVTGLKFTPSEFDLIKNIPNGSRRFLVKQGDNSAIAELNLSGFDEELSVLSGTPDTAAVLDGVIEEVGNDPRDFLPVFYRRVRSVKEGLQ